MIRCSPARAAASPECRGGVGILAFEVRIAERVHEVVGRLAAGHRGAQGGGVVNVSVDGRAGSGVIGGVAGHGDDVVAGLGQGRAQPAADEAGRAARRAPSPRPLNVLGLGHRVARHQPGPHGARDLRRGAGSGQGERGAPGERGELRGEGLEGLRQGRGEDDEVRAPRVDRPRQLLDRGVHPEVVDPPPVAVEHDAEDHQRQVVKLPGGAGEDGAGAVPVPPAPGQPGEPPADDVAGEVLLGDAGRSALPALPELGEIRAAPRRGAPSSGRGRTRAGPGLPARLARRRRRGPAGGHRTAHSPPARRGAARRPGRGPRRPRCPPRAPLAPPRRPTARRARWACIRRTRDSSASEYSRKPPAERTG